MPFRLYTLLLVLLFVVASWAAFGITGGIFFFVTIGLLALYIRYSATWPVIAHVLIISFFLWVLASLLLPAGCSARHAARRAACTSNLKQIGLALHNYHQNFKCFPPAYVADENGKPMHSWRVLILPYMGYYSLYNQYNFNEPWDGPNNKKLLTARPRIYACPSDEKAFAQDATCTSYVAVVGSDACWRGGKPRSYADFRGNASDTIMVIEVADAGIDWTEPRDLDFDALQTANSTPSHVKVSSKHMRGHGLLYKDTLSGVYAAMADGSVRFLPAGNLRADNLKNLLAVGGYKEEDIVSSDSVEYLQVNWTVCIALAIWFISVGLLLYRAIRSRKGTGEFAVQTAGGTEAPMNTDKNGSDQ